MTELRVAHTSELSRAELQAARDLLFDVFEGDFDAHDWEHALGGMHARLFADGELVGHASVVQRRLVHGGRALRAGYVEGVGVRADVRRRGHGAALMAAIERVVRGAYDLGALGATDQAAPLYAQRGWSLWRGPLTGLTPAGVVATPEEAGCVYVLECDVALDVSGELCCDWRDGDLW